MSGHRKPLVAGALANDISLSLFFGSLPQKTQRSLRYLLPETREDVDRAVDAAGAVVISRDLQAPKMRYIASRSMEAGVPFYYFADDNFWVLAKEYVAYSWFDRDESREIVGKAAGVVVSSDALADFMRDEKLNGNVLRMTPVLDPSLLDKRPTNPADVVTLAFAGGDHRERNLLEQVQPAIVQLARSGARVRFVAPGGRPYLPLRFNRVPLIEMAWQTGLRDLIAAWRRHTPDILLHPRTTSGNVTYKIDVIVLVSYLMGAVPIVTDEPAFRHVSEADGICILREETPAGWANAISRLLDPTVRAATYAQLAAYCARAYSPKVNEAVIDGILKSAA
jgi:hypothetical protein